MYFELILPSEEDRNAWVDWHPPMSLKQYGSFKKTSFSNGYEFPDPTEGRAELVKNNCAIIKKWKIPILGETQTVKTLTDGATGSISYFDFVCMFYISPLQSLRGRHRQGKVVID